MAKELGGWDTAGDLTDFEQNILSARMGSNESVQGDPKGLTIATGPVFSTVGTILTGPFLRSARVIAVCDESGERQSLWHTVEGSANVIWSREGRLLHAYDNHSGYSMEPGLVASLLNPVDLFAGFGAGKLVGAGGRALGGAFVDDVARAGLRSGDDVAEAAARLAADVAPDTVHVSTTRAAMEELAARAGDGSIRWFGSDPLRQTLQRAIGSGTSTATGRRGFNLLRERLGRILTLRGPIHHLKFPINRYGAQAMVPENLYLTLGDAHLVLHRFYGSPGRIFSAMAPGMEQDGMQSMLNFWLTLP